MMGNFDRQSACQLHLPTDAPLLRATVGRHANREPVSGAGESGHSENLQQRYLQRRSLSRALPHSVYMPRGRKSRNKR
jgi:hypothetical protein